jgi:hypothetical protein
VGPGLVAVGLRAGDAVSKIYAKLSLTKDELATVRSSVSASRTSVFDKWVATAEGPEKEFYSKRIDALDALIEKLRKPLEDDKSQDAEAEEDEEEDD